MGEGPKQIEGACAGCGAEFCGRVTDSAMESWGWRKIDGKWRCNLCTGAGYAGLYRKEEGGGMNRHVYPVNDLEEHDTENAATCKCEPRVELVGGDSLIIHNAFDGREIIERLEAGENP